MTQQLPRGWRIAPLQEVCVVVSGSTPKTGTPEFWNGDIPWVTPDDLARHNGKMVAGGRRCLTQAGYESCSTRLVPAGSVLYSSRAHIGYAAVASRALCTNQGFKTAVPGPELSSDFLFWQLLARTKDITDRASGTTFKEISGRAFGATALVIPPLQEQRRIVAVLEGHLSRLDAAVGYLHAAAARSSSFLTATHDAALRSPEEVPLSSLLTEPLRNGQSNPASQAGAVRTLTLTAVTEGLFEDRYTKMTAADPARVAPLWLKHGDILVQRSNTPALVGTTAMYAGPENWAIYPDLMIRVRVDASRIRPAYAALALSTTRSRARFRALAKGLAGSMPKIDQAAIATTRVPLPDLAAQDAVLERFEEVRREKVRLDRAREEAASRATALRRELLASAFGGRL